MLAFATDRIAMDRGKQTNKRKYEDWWTPDVLAGMGRILFFCWAKWETPLFDMPDGTVTFFFFRFVVVFDLAHPLYVARWCVGVKGYPGFAPSESRSFTVAADTVYIYNPALDRSGVRCNTVKNSLSPALSSSARSLALSLGPLSQALTLQRSSVCTNPFIYS